MTPVTKTFLKGLIAIIPLTLTLYLLLWLAGTAEFALGNIFKLFFPDSWYIKGSGFVLGLAVVFFFGNFLNSQIFLRIFTLFEELVIQIPVVKNLYSAIRDFISLFSDEQKGKFKQVVNQFRNSNGYFKTHAANVILSIRSSRRGAANYGFY